MKTRLRDLREDNDLTQEACAKTAFFSKNSYIRYEKGIREIPSDVLTKLADYHNVSTDYILGRTNNPKMYK